MRSLLLLALLAPSCVLADDILIREGLGIRVQGSRRSAIHIDPIEFKLSSGRWESPVAGKDGWAAVTANDKGEFSGGVTSSGYIYTTVELDRAKVMLLEASGHTMVYVNGSPRAGDPYSYGYLGLPIQLKKGKNELLFLCGRGRLQAKLSEIAKPLAFDLRDTTLPDYVEGDTEKLLGAVVVRNSTPNTLTNVAIAVNDLKTQVPSIPPFSIRKVGFEMPPAMEGIVNLKLLSGALIADEGTINIRHRKPGETYRVTFRSQIDGSLQYYAVNPSTRPAKDQALFLSLHGASVEAQGQADAYSPKSWGTLVAATNRRPYGFDWEEVGRLDALEVLNLAKERFEPDPSKIYLTGHSMGGHGTWQIGAHFPNLFAAIAPSAGWISFQSYAGGVSYQNPTPAEQMLVRASTPSDTLGLKYNYSARGVYVLHGDADDNVPVDQARTMRKELEPFHHDLAWHEEKGANHWWDSSEEPGADAVDYAAIWDFFSKHRLPRGDEVRSVDFTTASPGISSSLHWATILQQDKAFEFSRVQIQALPLSAKFVGTTSNVAALSLSIAALVQKQKISVEIDGQKLEPDWPTVNRIFLKKVAGKWEASGSPSPAEKNPARSGGFKDIFKNRFALVYGTKGTPEENAWSFAKAQYDAESFYYRGNGSVDVLPDTAIGGSFEDRNYVVYGNADTNSAYARLVTNTAMRVDRTGVTIGQQKMVGKDLGVFFIRPLPNSESSSVAVVGGTGLVGMKITERAPFFSSGAGYPDFLVLGIDSLQTGTKGIRAVGYFDNQWNFDPQQTVFQFPN
jgi:poly(3-hydroxybutyrate) depolymerase